MAIERAKTATPRRALAAILGAALAARVAFIFYLDPSRIYFSDTIVYVDAAESLLAGHGFGETYVRQPLYPVFLAGVLAVFPDRLVAVKLVEALLGCATVYLTYLVGNRIWDRRAGLLAAGLVAVHPYLVALTAFAYAEVLFTFLLLASTWALLRGRTWLGLGGAGLLAGAAVLTKASGLALVAAGSAWLLLASEPAPVGDREASIAAGRGRRWLRGRRRHALRTGAFLGSAALVAAPWVLRNARTFGDVSFLDAARKVHVSFRPSLGSPIVIEVEHHRWRKPEGQGRRSLKRRNAAHFTKQLTRFWSLTPRNLKTAKREVRERAAARDARMVVDRHPVERSGTYEAALVALLLPYYLLALVGVCVARGNGRESALLILLVLAFWLGRAALVARLRYRLPIEPEVALFAAAGALWVWGRLGLSWRQLGHARRQPGATTAAGAAPP